MEILKQKEDVLLTTMAMTTEGIDLPQVESLVLYDVPRSPLKVMEIYGRFQRFAQTKTLKLIVLCESRREDPAVIMALDKLREIMADEGSVGLGEDIP